MVSKRWAVMKLSAEDIGAECGACGERLGEPTCEGCHELVTVLDERDERTIRRAADAFDLIAQVGQCKGAHVFASALRALLPAPPKPPSATIDVVFDGPPSHESGRFVEVEDVTGKSINAGEWVERGDGLWALRIDPAALLARASRTAKGER